MIDQIQATEQPVAVCMLRKPLFRRKLCHEKIPTNSKEFTYTPPVKIRRAYITVAAVSAFEGKTFFFLKKKKKSFEVTILGSYSNPNGKALAKNHTYRPMKQK